MRVKICGITKPDDARYAESAGADAIGVVMFSSSPRSVSCESARAIFGAVGPFISTVAVTHTQSDEELAQILALRPAAVQISHRFVFDDDPGVKVLRMIGRGDMLPDDCDAVVVDESRGAGRQFDPSFARDVVQRSEVPVILAGGLTPENVGRAIKRIHPYAVDVASGVERAPGIKDREKIAAFIAASRGV